MVTRTKDPRQLDLDHIVNKHFVDDRKSFGITQKFLLGLDIYNNILNTSGKDTDHDNLLVRDAFNGMHNSKEMPAELYSHLNATEIVLLQAAIKKRKYVRTEETLMERGMPPKYFTVKKGISEPSRIAEGGNLDKGLYDIVEHLFSQTEINRIYRTHRKEWEQASQNSDRHSNYLKVNPYDPSKIKERMESLERANPELVEQVKEVLAKPYVPEKIRIMNKYGNTRKTINPEGFETPGKTYRRGVKGKSFFRITQYADTLRNYYHKLGNN